MDIHANTLLNSGCPNSQLSRPSSQLQKPYLERGRRVGRSPDKIVIQNTPKTLKPIFNPKETHFSKAHTFKNRHSNKSAFSAESYGTIHIL